MADKTVADHIVRAAWMGASDVHLLVGSPPIYRLQGNLVTSADDGIVQEHDMKMLVRKVMPEAAAVRRLDEGNPIDFTMSLPEKGRARLNIYTSGGLWAAAARILPSRIPGLDQLGLPPVVRSMISRASGLLLVSGTSGSGKTTSLASILDHINHNRPCHIITLEDPVEYLHQNIQAVINQREIGLDSPSFTLGLKAALRQDPDIIMVGEMRDLEDIAIVLTAAETGHLVLASVHSGSAVQTLERVVDAFPPHQQQQVRTQVAQVLVGIIHQRLFPSTFGNSRVLAAEILVMTPAVRNMVRGGKMHLIQSSLQTGAAQGMVSMRTAVKMLLEQNKISDQTATQVSEQMGRYE